MNNHAQTNLFETLLYTKLCLIFISYSASFTFGQTVEFGSGINHHKILPSSLSIDFHEITSTTGSMYHLGLNELQVDSFPLRIGLFYARYGATIRDLGTSFGELNAQVEYRSHDIGLEVYPLQFNWFNALTFEAGVHIAYTVNLEQSSYLYEGNQVQTVHFLDYSIVNPVKFGLITRLGYGFHISDRLTLSPQYRIFATSLREFRGTGKVYDLDSFTVRHFAGISVAHRINRD
ncbi:MAG: hypothetical protein JJ975_15390 [Bacteroidia bacterium]|nr:hypothetical protein [Bacteroidia bacterium]